MDGHLEVEFSWDEFERLIERERSDYQGGESFFMFNIKDRRETSHATESDLNALLVRFVNTKFSKIEFRL